MPAAAVIQAQGKTPSALQDAATSLVWRHTQGASAVCAGSAIGSGTRTHTLLTRARAHQLQPPRT